MKRSVVLALTGAATLAAALPAVSSAGWTDAQLASVDNARLEQGDGASNAVDVSGDGRWVVFQTRASNFFGDDDPDPLGRTRQGGVFRFDRTTGAIALVADGDQMDDDSGELLLRGASAPSVSDDGRYVVFATAQRLVPQDDNDNVDVYRRDMALPLGLDRAAGAAYTLVSARDGGDDPAHYEPREPALPGRTPGASVFAGQAISGDGRYVAFRTVEQKSDLPANAGVDTPAGSVFVRDVQQRRTVLASPALDGSGPVGGAQVPVVLSRDGSTVAWVGENAPRQTRFVGGETLDDAQRYYLWRRWDEPGARTRRITGIADPDDPACGLDGHISPSVTSVAPCDGPLTDTDASSADIGGRAPALSADGMTVAFVSGAGPRPAQDSDVALDAYVTSMRPGVTRKSGTRVVTKGTTSANAAVNGDVESVAISADGSRVLLATTRRQFLPPAPPLIGDPRSSAGSTELYTTDLTPGGGTRRILRPGGADLNGAVDANTALSADGRVIAFVSRASNLVFGDANEMADAFVVQEVDDQQTAPPPSGLGEDAIDEDVTSISDDFALRVTSRKDGTLGLRVVVPVAGAVRAIARTRPVRASRAARSRGSVRRAVRARRVKVRQVASGRATARRRTTVSITLRLSSRDRRSLLRGATLPVRVTATLAPRAGGRARTTAANATFRVKAKPAKKKPSRTVVRK
jgi:Tol biopolymer transport system component